MGDGDETLSFYASAPGISIEKASDPKRRIWRATEHSDVERGLPNARKKDNYNPPDFYWESSATPFHLVKSVGQKAAQKLLLLLVITLDVSTHPDHIQDCSRSNFNTSFEVGFCAFTKSFVRCFPLLAIMLTVTITMKQMEFKRVFYQTLKRKGLLIYEHFNFHHDPDYLVMIFFFFMAVLHFAQLICCAIFPYVKEWDGSISSAKELIRNQSAPKNGTEPDNNLETAKSVIPFYVLPAFMWWGLFVGVYDTAKLSLPLMKFFQQEPEPMQKWIGECKIMREPMAAWVLRQRVALRPATDTETLYDSWIDESARLSKLSQAEQDKLTKVPVLNNNRMVDIWWPSRILFAERLNDADSREFRLWFDLMTLICFVIFAVVLFFICFDCYDAYVDFFVDKKMETWPSFVIYCFFTFWAFRIMYKLMNKTRMLSTMWEDIDLDEDEERTGSFLKRQLNDAMHPTELAPLIEEQEPGRPPEKQSHQCVTS